MFVGRQFELQQLEKLFKKQSASLVAVKGRRRIGKSRLVAEFAKKGHFIQIVGVSPTASTTPQLQIDQFMDQVALKFPGINKQADNWAKAFHVLAQQTKSQRCVILFDEISWMGSQDDTFLGQLKNAWDNEFSANSQLILVLCGSVSTWIEKEIINSTLFLGRLSLNLTLKELDLRQSFSFIKNTKISIYEKLKILAVTGGIPRYLELIDPQLPAHENIKNLLFVPGAPLLYEYDRIFNDIFGKKSELYKAIVECLITGAKTQSELLQQLAKAKGGDISSYLQDLSESGFVERHFTFNIKNKSLSNKSKYRVKDNFLRFYLKFVSQYLLQIDSGIYEKTDLNALPGWSGFLGLQFESLILNNMKLVIEKLHIDPLSILFFGPYFQQKTNRKAGCQVDLLIQTNLNTLYVCEIKFSKNPIGTEVISELDEKIKRLSPPKGFSVVPILVHANGMTEQLEDKHYFPYVVSVSDFVDASYQ